MTRWRAFTEVSVAWIVAFVITATVGSVIARRREAQSLALSGS
jgi:hypothetical protein